LFCVVLSRVFLPVPAIVFLFCVVLSRVFQYSVAPSAKMPTVMKPDPTSSVDASHLLEGENEVAWEDTRMESIAPSIAIYPIHPSRRTRLARPTSPQKPPSSIVGGYGLPDFATIWTTSEPAIMMIQTVDFTVVQKGLECHLRLLVTNRPSGLAPLLTEDQWNDLRSRFDELGVRIKWDVYRSLILLVIIFVMIVIFNFGDEPGEGFSLGDSQMGVLIFLGVILIKLVWDECYENYSRRAVFHEVDVACKEFSALMRPRGACLAFRFADNDEHGLLADLVFYKVETAEENMLSIT
jgi:hypothetical protein